MRHLFIVLISLVFMGCFDKTAPANNGNTTTTTTTTQPTTTTTQPTTDNKTNTPTTPTTKKDTKATEKKAGYAGKWIHSKEEDSEKFEVYRADGFNFPPARGRKYMVIKSDNTVEYNSIAPNDTFLRVSGTVQPFDDDKFQIVLMDDKRTTINVYPGEVGILKLEKPRLPLD